MSRPDWRGWAIAGPDGKLVLDAYGKAPFTYKQWRECWLDCEDGCKPVRVVIHIERRKPK